MAVERVDTEALVADFSQLPIRGWMMGRPGSAKTSSLEALLRLGLNVHLLSIDGNFRPLLLQVHQNCPEHASRLDIVRLSQEWAPESFDRFLEPSGTPLFTEITRALNRWPNEDKVPTPHPNHWGAQDHVLVVDNLSPLSSSCITYIRQSNGLLNKPMDFKHWQAAHDMVYAMCENLAVLQTNVLVLAHVEFVDVTVGEGLIRTMGFPETVGKKLGGKIAGTFDTAFLFEREPADEGDYRYLIRVRPTAGVDVKVPLPPELLRREYTVDNGLGEIFAHLRGQEPPPLSSAQMWKQKEQVKGRR